MAIIIYNLLNIILTPLYLIILAIRIIKKKDTLSSALERIGRISKLRSNRELIWIHAASVGESMVAITLINALNVAEDKYRFLVTTGTLSSADILAKSLPPNAIHQFTPLDNLWVVKRFLNYWQPKLGLFIESELWPCLISEASSRFKLILLNARLSDRSYKRWEKAGRLFQAIIKHFSLIIAQSKSDYKKYKSLGSRNILNLGNLKFANKELEVDRQKLVELKRLIKNNKIFVAASTHKEDEEATLSIIKRLKKAGIFTIIILRHPERMKELSAQCKNLGLKYSVRSKDEHPSIADDLYIVDSFGELGLFYTLASVVFVGGSFKRGGHNLVEPAYFNNTVILGPDMSNFQNIADEMVKKKAAIQIQDQQELAQKIIFFFNKEGQGELEKYKMNARKFVEDQSQIIENYKRAIARYL